MVVTLSKVDLNLTAIKSLIPVRDKDAYKNLFGHVLIIAGNHAMGGAAQMATMATVNSGAGLTTVATDSANLPAIHTVMPEAMIIDWTHVSAVKQMIEKVDVLLVGPGLGMDNLDLWQLIKTTIVSSKHSLKIILDADALNLLATDLAEDEYKTIQELLSPENQHEIILTPHQGEWRRLSAGKVPAEDQASIQNWVNQTGTILVLKGSSTEIYVPNELVIHRNPGGNPGMATGGMGDTLAGMIAGLAGQLNKTADAVKLAVFLHSYIGDQLYEDHYVVLPSQISKRIPYTMKEISKKEI
ncbi:MULTISPECIES: NAD(P)H-hydrate dehydratase [Aerococcus]|uniref:NAD(P)H-hydrate dehydratase n=1 Tax=Aerococcus TaxID=1375 RepID=UPI003AA9D23B